MSTRDFLGSPIKQKVTRLIKEIEAQTAAEVVVTVRKSSGNYRHVDYLSGAIVALIGLLIFLFHPDPFNDDIFPIAEVILFFAGSSLSLLISPWRRLLAGRKLREENSGKAARAAFYDLGISRTNSRTGLLISISLFEQNAEVLTDIGIDTSALDAEWNAALQDFQRAVEQGDTELFLAGMKRMGPPLSKLLPRAEDDVNELPDEVQ